MMKKTPDKKRLAGLDTPAVFNRRNSHRDCRRALRLENAKEAIGDLFPGCEIYGFTKGQFCLIHILEHVLEQIGPCDVDIATWSAASGDIREAHRFLKLGKIKRLRFLVDYSFRSRKPEFCDELVQKFGKDAIRVTSIHAKFATLRGEDYQIVIRTSMNLNYNPRFENFEISDDPGMWRFMRDIVDEIWANDKLADVDIMRPSDVKREFNRSFGCRDGMVEVKAEALEVVRLKRL